MNSASACSKKIGSLLVAALASTSIAVHAQTPASAEVAKTCSFVNIANLALKSDGMTVTADGSVNQTKAVMLIASGAQNTLLTKVEASKLGLSAPASTGKGKKAALDTRSQIDEFSIGSIELGKMRILTMTKLGDYPEYGALIGADFLFQHDLELTLATGTLRFFKPVGCEGSNLAYWDENAAAVALSDLSPGDHRPVITVELNGQKMRALIDSAAPVSVLDLASAARLGVTPHSSGVTPMKKADQSGTSSSSWIAPFSEFSVGGEVIKNVKMPILDLKKIVNADNPAATPDMILGEDFLHAHRVLFALSQHQFYFSYLSGKVFNMDAQADAATAPKS